MIFHDVKQGTPEWQACRIGIPTASQFGRIVTAKTMKLSAQADKYIGELAAADYLQMPIESADSPWMQRGTAMEPEARAYLEFAQGVKIEPAGFCTTDDGLVGASPDGFIGADGLVEIKLYEAAHHVMALLDPDPIEHRAQVAGGLWIAERKYCLRLYYNPELPSLIVRIDRDDEYVSKLKDALYGENGFLGRLALAMARLRDLGGKTADRRS